MLRNKEKSLAKKKIVLADDNDEVHEDINTISAATKAGLLEKEPGPKGKPAVLTSEGLIEYALTLPATAFTLFDMAKSFGLVKDGAMTFDQWVYVSGVFRDYCQADIELTGYFPIAKALSFEPSGLLDLLINVGSACLPVLDKILFCK